MPGRYVPGISPEQMEGTPDPEPLLEDTNTTVQQITLFTLTVFTVMSFLDEIEV